MSEDKTQSEDKAQKEESSESPMQWVYSAKDGSPVPNGPVTVKEAEKMLKTKDWVDTPAKADNAKK